jgi:hypothetical protein
MWASFTLLLQGISGALEVQITARGVLGFYKKWLGVGTGWGD